MKLKNDPYFPVIAFAMIAALVLALVNPSSHPTSSSAHPATPANTLVASPSAVTPAE